MEHFSVLEACLITLVLVGGTGGLMALMAWVAKYLSKD